MRWPGRNDRPFLQLEIGANDDADYDRLQAALAEIIGLDPRLRTTRRPQRRLFILQGREKADFQWVCDRLRDTYQLPVNVGLLDAVFLESICKGAEGEGKYIRQTGGKGNYGHCKLRIEPSETGDGYEFVNDIRDGAVPNQYIKPIEEGVLAAMEMGILSGFPVVDVKVTLYGGSYHEADSNEMAFKLAGATAFKEAGRNASPVLLEPMMAVVIEVPEQLAPATQRQINALRGRIGNKLSKGGLIQLTAIVPLSELLASGAGRFAKRPMEFAGYEPVLNQGPSDENGSSVIANKPNGPQPGNRSAAARHPAEDEE